MIDTTESLGMTFSRLSKDAEESKIRLYGVLWLLFESEIISEGRARELGNMPLHKMIDACMRYQVEFEEISGYQPIDDRSTAVPPGDE